MAATNINSALKQLVTVTTWEYAEVKLSLDALAANPCNFVPRTCTIVAMLSLAKKRKLKKRIKPLNVAIKHTLKVGGFCSTHDRGAGADHN